MGKQYNKIQKSTRRKAYNKRKKTILKAKQAKKKAA